MRNAQGGTKKWCPKCKDIRVVKVQPSYGRWTPNQSMCWPGFEAIRYFARDLECQTCRHYWISAEVPVGVIRELRELRSELDMLRNQLHVIKETVEAQLEEFEYGSLRLLSGD